MTIKKISKSPKTIKCGVCQKTIKQEDGYYHLEEEALKVYKITSVNLHAYCRDYDLEKKEA